MLLSEKDVPSSYKVTFKPNCTLSASGKQRVLLLLTLVPIVIGISFAFLGAWLILPFVGLEIVALICAFYYINKHEADYESISIENDTILIERCVGGSSTKEVMNPYWVKVVKHELANGELYVYLQSHGKELQVGRYLTRKQREFLAKQLQQRTGIINGNI
jgi:uncharacterized membrane protein